MRIHEMLFVLQYVNFFSLSIGCEFFRDFKENEYNADGLHFNWQQVIYQGLLCGFLLVI